MAFIVTVSRSDKPIAATKDTALEAWAKATELVTLEKGTVRITDTADGKQYTLTEFAKAFVDILGASAP